ncbi:hypothetical protein BC830DRAFT_275158 [Chytriomyces sp. MP71]|nr:hypothetical protein BC830DRAFT_275158 [Chytriomyces sp. MP71]
MKADSNESLHEITEQDTTTEPAKVISEEKGEKKKTTKKKRSTETGTAGESEKDDSGEKRRRKSTRDKRKSQGRRRGDRDGSESENDGVDADNESEEDPFNEFKEATERAEMEMLGNYVTLSKWEPMMPVMTDALKKLLFYPEDYVLPPSESLTALFEHLRFPAQEGLYVGRIPTVKTQNLTKIERRLRASEPNHGTTWFGADQRLANLPNPKRSRTQRPGAPPPIPIAQAAPTSKTDSNTSLSRSSISLRLLEESSPILEDADTHAIDGLALVLRKPAVTTPYRLITDNPNGHYTLVFSLGSLNFVEHPLMVEECKIAKEVEDLIYTLRTRKKTDLVGFLSRKLEALKAAYAEYVDRTERILNAATLASEEESEGIYPAKPVGSKYYEKNVLPREESERESLRIQDQERRKEFRTDIRSTRLLRDSESQTNRLLEFKILQGWDRIKKLRKKTSITNTSLRVMVRARGGVTTVDDDKMMFRREVENELLELEDIHDAEMERKRRLYKIALQEWRKRRAEEEEKRLARKSEIEAERAEAAKITKNKFGMENDPLEEIDDDEMEKLVDDGRSGHEWLRESSESLLSLEAREQDRQYKRARRLERKSLTDQEKLDTEKPRLSLWDRLTRTSRTIKSPFATKVNEPSLLDQALRTPRTKSLPPTISIPTNKRDSSPRGKNMETPKIDSAIVSSPPKKSPLRQRGRRRSGARKEKLDDEIILSQSSLVSGRSLSSTCLNEDTRKWRHASRDRLHEPLKLRRPSSRPRINLDALPPSGTARMRRKSQGRELATEDETTDAETFVRRKASTPKSHKKKSKIMTKSDGIFSSSDSMPMAPSLEAFDIEKARRDITKRLDSSLKPPGAPILSINHVYTEHPTEFLHCPKDEQQRRREIEHANLYARIYYNGKEVTRTIPQPIDMERFTVKFKGLETIAIDESPLDSNEARLEDTNVFGVRVKEVPDSVKMEFYETTRGGSKFIGEVFVPIPDPAVTVCSHDREMSTLAFGGQPFFQKYTTHHSMQLENKWIAGSIKLNVAWGVNEEGKSLGPPLTHYHPLPEQACARYTDPLSIMGPSGLLNLRKLMDWIMDVKFDPNDPRNTDVLKLKKLVQMGGHEGLSFHEYWSQRRYFRLEMPTKMKQLAQGVGLDESMDTKRLTLLKKRFSKEIVVKGPVPLDDKDITEDLWEKVANPLEDDSIALALWKPKTSGDAKPASISLADSVGFLKRIRMHQLIQRARQGRPPRVEDFVREERIVELQQQENLFLALFMPKRPLKPLRVSRLARLTSQPEDGCKIVVKVLQGFNVPVRKLDPIIRMGEEKSPSVRSYVEVSFQGRKARTGVYDGSNPHWNETLYLDVRPPNNDFKPENLLDSEVAMERIYFHVFDELLVDIIDDDRERENEIHQRRERNWIGTFSMPFTSLYEQTRIEGQFHVQVPSVLLGYEKNVASGTIESAMFLALDATKETLLDLFITLEPPLMQPAPLKLKFLSDETDRFLRYVNSWSKAPLTHPQRVFNATTLDLSGRTTFLPRYIRPQDPPPELLTPRHLLRYVSSIPFLADRTAFSADISLWATSDQMLELAAGDAAEHAILLCNFLLAKGGDSIEVFVVLGNGIPEGRTAYVAMRTKAVGMAGLGKGADMTLMNAVTGESYSIRDPHLPLKVVWCVFNEVNVWANIQPHDDPPRMDWTISNGKKWKPFFCRSFPKTLYKSVQLEKLTYKEVSARHCQELETAIEKSVVAKMEEWRGHRITRWNRLASKSLKPLVSRMEADHLQPLPINTPQNLTPLYTTLAPLRSVYRISGFPLHTTFTDIKAVVEMVEATDVHMNADPSAEFALAVWCGGYPGGFISVWIYVCSLTRGKGDIGM